MGNQIEASRHWERQTSVPGRPTPAPCKRTLADVFGRINREETKAGGSHPVHVLGQSSSDPRRPPTGGRSRSAPSAVIAVWTICSAVRWVRSNSRMDCWAKIGAKSNFLAAARWPGVARPRRSPNPNDFTRPRVDGGCGPGSEWGDGWHFSCCGVSGVMSYSLCSQHVVGHTYLTIHFTKLSFTRQCDSSILLHHDC
jgi:hypothetical protein